MTDTDLDKHRPAGIKRTYETVYRCINCMKCSTELGLICKYCGITREVTK